MRGDEVRGISQLAVATLRGGTTRVFEVQQGIADRTFDAIGPAGAPVRAVHDALAGTTYAAVRTALGMGARAAGSLAALRADGRDLDSKRRGRVALAVLNGAHGDLLQREAPALAMGMTVRVEGQPVPVEAGPEGPRPDAPPAARPAEAKG